MQSFASGVQSFAAAMQNFLDPKKIVVIGVEFYGGTGTVALKHFGDELLFGGSQRAVTSAHMVVVTLAEATGDFIADALHVTMGHAEEGKFEAARHAYLGRAAVVGACCPIFGTSCLGVDGPEALVVFCAPFVRHMTQTSLCCSAP